MASNNLHPDNAQNGAKEVSRRASDSALPSPAATKGPAGGFDDTPIPHAPPGFTLKFTFHRAENLPFGDLSTLSSDPYVRAILEVDLPSRHPKLDPIMSFRTPTIRRNVNPVWNSEWIVANVPASGFQLKCLIFDEDQADHDDRLGRAYVETNSLTESWPGMKEQAFKIKKRMGSQRAYLLRSIVAGISKNVSTNGILYVSVECLGRTPGDDGRRVYTIGPNRWTKHYSALIGRLAGTKVEIKAKDGKSSVLRYNFQAIQIQLTGPVPEPLYHRYVEFRPFVAGMFTAKSLRGRLLNNALHHQHARIYTFDSSTEHGINPQFSPDLTRQFLEFVQYDQGGRIFTYVLTLDGQWRFTETGKEFGIDLLSKHTMHSNVSIYIAYSGEFFVRKARSRKQSSKPSSSSNNIQEITTTSDAGQEQDHKRSSVSKGEGEAEAVSKDPSQYELIIDNDSGTYRPNAKLLPLLKEFLSKNLPGLNITTLDCQKDADYMAELKKRQREKKKATGRQIMYLQRTSSSFSNSSFGSDEEKLEERLRKQNGSGTTTTAPGEEKGKVGSFFKKANKAKHAKASYKAWLEADHQDHHDRPLTS